MIPSANYNVIRGIKDQFCNWGKIRSISLSLSALTGLVATASELWLSTENTIFDKIVFLPTGALFLIFLSFLLFLLYCIEWHRKADPKITISMILFSGFCTLCNILLMYILTFIVYLAIGGLSLENTSEIWKFLYLAIPLALGEFSLTSITSRQLRKAKELEKKVRGTVERLEGLFERIEDSSNKELVPSELRDDYWSKYLDQKREENKDERRGRTSKTRDC